MKKRNQLVGALLAGVLLGGGMTGTTIWAATEDTANEAVVQDSEPTEETDTSGNTSETADKAPSEESEETSEAADQSEHDESAASNEESSSATNSEEDKSGGSTDAGQSQQETTKTAEEAQAEAAAKAQAEAEAQAKAEEEARQQAAESQAKAQAESDASAQKKEEDESRQNASEKEKKEKAEREKTAKTADQNRSSGNSTTTSGSGGSSGSSAGSRSSAGSGSTVSSPAFVLTEAQKIQNLRIGFKQIAKQYAIVNVGNTRYLRIRDSKSASGTVVGTVNNGGLLYVLADDDPDWVYIESGTVRGFAMKKWLVLGTEAEKQVEAKGGDDKLVRAAATVSPTDNKAYRYSLNTVESVFNAATSINRQQIVNYALSFVGGNYVWGGDDPHTGADCSGFVKYVYEHFGYTGLPRVSYEQCYAGTRIDAKDAKPGDLLFYARDGVVYHVLMYIGNGKAVNAQSTATGIVVSDVNYDKVCWGVRLINDNYTSTQASALTEDGKKASNGDTDAQQRIIQALATAAQKAYDEYGFPKSVMIAQAIQESGWLSFSGSANGGIQPADNNILGMNASLLNSQWTSPWKGTAVNRNVPQTVNGKTVMGVESMRAYDDIESCLEDYAAFKIGIHPDLRGSTDIDKVISEGLAGYATDPSYETSIKNIITKYNLTQYDTGSVYATDTTSYTQDQLDLIWAVVAQEDDTSYEGALAVISTVMNRADLNYGGYGTNALSQLTADGQFAYSPKVSSPSLYQRRLNGNVPDFVKQAVSDCLTRGIRNHNFLSFRSSNSNGISTQIGSNWYFT